MTWEFHLPAALERVPLPPGLADRPVPHFVDAFLRDAADRAEEYDADWGEGRFVPGDSRHAFQVLAWLLESGCLNKGAAFLEWGSGQGMATILAAFLGLEATGVEKDARLVAEARQLALRYDAPAQFLHGTYLRGEPGLKSVPASRRAVIYVYPWPGEETYFLQLFAETADAGAHLLMCLGPDEIHVYRKRPAP